MKCFVDGEITHNVVGAFECVYVDSGYWNMKTLNSGTVCCGTQLVGHLVERESKHPLP